MDPADHTAELVDRDVFDAAGRRLGRVDSLYCDVEDPDIVFAAVAVIRRGRRRLVFVSLVGASISAESVTVRCGALLARRAPRTRPGRGLPVELEADLYRHYDIPYRRRDHAAARLQTMSRGKPRL